MFYVPLSRLTRRAGFILGGLPTASIANSRLPVFSFPFSALSQRRSLKLWFLPLCNCKQVGIALICISFHFSSYTLLFF